MAGLLREAGNKSDGTITSPPDIRTCAHETMATVGGPEHRQMTSGLLTLIYGLRETRGSKTHSVTVTFMNTVELEVKQIKVLKLMCKTLINMETLTKIYPNPTWLEYFPYCVNIINHVVSCVYEETGGNTVPSI